MKTLRPILAMLAFLALGFLADYVVDRVIPGEPLPYYWLSFLCVLIFGASILWFIHLVLHKELLVHGTSIAYVIVGAVLLLWTPVVATVMQTNPDLPLPGFTARSFFIISGLIVEVAGVYALLPKPKKRKK